jgi:hypothetical protein
MPPPATEDAPPPPWPSAVDGRAVAVDERDGGAGDGEAADGAPPSSIASSFLVAPPDRPRVVGRWGAKHNVDEGEAERKHDDEGEAEREEGADSGAEEGEGEAAAEDEAAADPARGGSAASDDRWSSDP